MKTIYFLKGLPASGKSTWAKEMVASHDAGTYKRVNKDDLRAMLDVSKHSKGNEKFVLKIRDIMILEALKEGKHVICDDTNFNPKHEARMREMAAQHQEETGKPVQIIVKFFEISLEDAIARDLKRPNSVGERVIRTMYNEWIKPKLEKDTQTGKHLVYQKQDESLPKAIIADMDGTLAIICGRNPYAAEHCERDLPNEPIIDIVRQYAQIGVKIIIVSGRKDTHKPQTENWLKANNVPYDLILMRKGNDDRGDHFVKIEIFNQHIKDKFFVQFILDDRNQVVDMWRKDLHLPCLQVNYGDF